MSLSNFPSKARAAEPLDPVAARAVLFTLSGLAIICLAMVLVIAR